MSQYEKAWIKALGARAGYTFAETLLAAIATAQLIEEVDWRVALSMACLAALVSILKSIVVGMPEVTL